METRFHLDLQAQPDDTTCGPTCLHGVYEYWGDPLPLSQVIDEVRALEEGGTLAVLLGDHALRRGYQVTIYPYNLHWLDPTWFELDMEAIAAKLREQAQVSGDAKRRLASQAYLEFLRLGGKLAFQDLSAELIAGYLQQGVPVLTGLSATWLYRASREDPRTSEDDDVGGWPTGHFVVLCGYDPERGEVLVADPYRDNPIQGETHYVVPVDRVLNAILLGIVTYDANLLLIEPGSAKDENA